MPEQQAPVEVNAASHVHVVQPQEAAAQHHAVQSAAAVRIIGTWDESAEAAWKPPQDQAVQAGLQGGGLEGVAVSGEQQAVAHGSAYEENLWHEVPHRGHQGPKAVEAFGDWEGADAQQPVLDVPAAGNWDGSSGGSSSVDLGLTDYYEDWARAENQEKQQQQQVEEQQPASASHGVGGVPQVPVPSLSKAAAVPEDALAARLASRITATVQQLLLEVSQH